MRDGQFSRTALAAAALRVQHRRSDTPVLFDDPGAERLLTRDELRLARLPPRLLRLETGSVAWLAACRGHVVGRAAFAEERLVRAVTAGAVHDYLILGAGLDSFAWRRPPECAELVVHEIDHPDTQREKRRRVLLGDLGDPGALDYISCDFGHQSLAERLLAGGVPDDRGVFCSWLGVTPYLPEAAVFATLEELAGVLAPGSELVCDVALRPAVLRPAVIGAGLLWLTTAILGERLHPLALTAPQLLERVARTGWQVRAFLDEHEFNRLVFQPRSSTLRTLPGTALLHLVRP